MEKTILVIDDSLSTLKVTEAALEKYYMVYTMESGKRAIRFLDKVRPDLILLDINMPEMDGFEVFDYLKSSEKYRDIPVIFFTGTPNNELESWALTVGAVDFITKPFSEMVLLNRIGIHLEMSEIIRERTAQLTRSKHDIIFVLADVVENRDEDTGDHLGRTSRHVKLLIEQMQKQKIYYDIVKDWDADTMAECSLLHDAGKINTPDEILKKPGKLTPDEFTVMKLHTTAGKKIIEKIINRSGENKFLSNAIHFALYHHERWDGTGYPYGLAGEDIPLQGRIMAIIDVYDALTSKRVYKDAFSAHEAVNIILEQKGKQFDPLIVDAFLVMLRESSLNA